MRPDAIARRYARALFSLAKARGSLDDVGAALRRATEALIDPKVMRVLTGPVPRDRKRALLGKIVELVAAPSVVSDFLFLLADHGRLSHADAILSVFDVRLDHEHGITRARIQSATPLSPDLLDGKVYDGSLRTELGKLQQQMATGS